MNIEDNLVEFTPNILALILSMSFVNNRMKTSIYTRHRFHPDVLRRAVWMYFRFNLSFRDVVELILNAAWNFPMKQSGDGLISLGPPITQETSEEPRRQTYENCYR